MRGIGRRCALPCGRCVHGRASFRCRRRTV